VSHARLEKTPVVTALVPTSVEPRYSPYPVTPTLSDEGDQDSAMLVAVRDVAETLVGAVGGWESAHGEVVAVTDALLERLPALSKASTASVYAVPQTSAATVPPGWLVVWATEPFRYTPYPTTATLSVDAVHASDTLVRVAPVTRSPVGCEGGLVSAGAFGGTAPGGLGGLGGFGQLSVSPTTVAAGERFAAASYATTERRYTVEHVRPVTVVSVSVTSAAYWPSYETRYPATPTLSVDGDHERSRLVPVRPVTMRSVGGVGAMPSVQSVVVTHAALCAERLPAASAASTSNRYVEPHSSPVSVATGAGSESTGTPS
jgi:hypothetical protein